MQKIIINDVAYEEVAGTGCDLCDIESVSPTCRRLLCIAKYRPDHRDVVYKRVVDGDAAQNSELF